MTMACKPRALISCLSIPTPIAKYFTEDSWSLDLSTNTNPYLGPYTAYPDVVHTSLKELYLRTLYGLDPHVPPSLSPDHLLLTAGSLEGIDILIRTLGEPHQDRICILQPTFSAYEHWAQIHSLKVLSLPLKGPDFSQVPVEEIVSLNPAMVFLCNPNNPTGTVVDVSQIQSLCESLKGFVIVDEAYIEFSRFPSLWPLLDVYPNLILLRTFSKAWGLAGVRLGVILAPPSLIRAFRHVQLPFACSQFAQERLKDRLEHPEEAFLSWKRIQDSRESLRDQLLRLESVETVFKSETNFLMIIFKNLQRTLDVLKDNHIFVLNCHPNIPHSLRVSLSTPTHNQRFLHALSRLSP